MIASEVTIMDTFFAFTKTKFDKNINEFMENYCYRQGKIIEQDEVGFVAELHSATRLDDETVTGMMYVTF